MQSVANGMSGNAYWFPQICDVQHPVAQVRLLYLRISSGTKVIAPVDYAVGSEKPQV